METAQIIQMTIGSAGFLGIVITLVILSFRVGKFTQKFDDFALLTHTNFQRIDKQFEYIEKQFDKIEQRFEKIDEKFKKVDERLDMMNEKLNSINIRIVKIELNIELPKESKLLQMMEQHQQKLTHPQN